MARANLADELAKPSFTPGRADAPALVELVASGDERAGAALAKLAVARDALAARMAARTDDEAGRARLIVALGLVARAGDALAAPLILAELADGSSRVRRAAIVAAGKLGDAAALDPLVARWDAGDAPPDERRALAEALGKLGGERALARLRALDPAGDAELARRRDRALLMIQRGQRREDASEVRTDVRPPAPITVRLHCRAGLAPLLVDELRAHGIAARADGDAAAETTLAGPWSTLFASRLWTTAGIRVPLAAETPEAITAAIVAARPLLALFTRGAIRWRLHLESKQRAVVWRVARDVTAAAPELVNDPTQTTWDLAVARDHLELVPRRAADPRFAYRVAEVPAASHPTVAAAIAWLSAPRVGDRVWDPFCGSGLELVERARAGDFATLEGSDLDAAALDAARQNLGVLRATLVHADARTHDPGPVDAIVTNPPLGSRVQLDATALLVACLPNFARRLAPGGRLVWITPAPKHTTPAAEALGLVRDARHGVDLGGVRGQLERWVLG